MRGDGIPTYNFAVVVDDWDMQISHVIRGADHINNTPRQINLYNAIGAPLPTFAHLPLIHGEDGQKLSKRNGTVSVLQYNEEGYLPEALFNYLARLGGATKTTKNSLANSWPNGLSFRLQPFSGPLQYEETGLAEPRIHQRI